jgi:hypothetical protein
LKRKKTNGRRRSNSSQLSERRWLVQHLKLWPKLEKLRKNSRSKSC